MKSYIDVVAESLAQLHIYIFVTLVYNLNNVLHNKSKIATDVKTFWILIMHVTVLFDLNILILTASIIEIVPIIETNTLDRI